MDAQLKEALNEISKSNKQIANLKDFGDNRKLRNLRKSLIEFHQMRIKLYQKAIDNFGVTHEQPNLREDKHD